MDKINLVDPRDSKELDRLIHTLGNKLMVYELKNDFDLSKDFMKLILEFAVGGYSTNLIFEIERRASSMNSHKVIELKKQIERILS